MRALMNPAASLRVFRFPYILQSWRRTPKLSVYRQPNFPSTICGLHGQWTCRVSTCIYGRGVSSTRDDLWTLSSIASPSYTVRSVPGALRSAKVGSVLSNRVVLSANRVAFLYTSTVSGATSDSTTSSNEGNFELVYRGPLRSAVRAVKVFSLTTCAAALVGGPILVALGNPSVPLLGRVLMTSFVMTIGISTTLILHWLMKGYVIEMYFDPKLEQLRVYTLTMLAGKQCHMFHLSEAGPPEDIAAFSTFQAKGKSYFMHTEIMENKELLGRILGPYMALEDSELWKRDKEELNSNTQQDKT